MNTLQQLIDQDYDIHEHYADRQLSDDELCEMADACLDSHLRQDEIERLREMDEMGREARSNPFADEEARQITAINRYLEQRRGY